MNKEYLDRLEKIEQVLSNALPEKISESWKTDSFCTEYEGVTEEHIKPLVEPCLRLVKSGGKRWRPLFLVLCAQMQQNGENQLSYELTPLLEFVHTASLIHDDIEDHADTRRGKPAAHITYGLDTALNAGAWLYFEAATCINTCSASDSLKLKLYQLYTSELRRLHLGQAMDIAWHSDTRKIPTTTQYLAMVKNKTGTLASFAAKTGILAGNGSDEQADLIGNIAADIGAGFQILDDVINITTGNPGKKRGDDIVEGKKSLPVLYYLNEVSKEKQNELFECFEKASKEGIESSYVEKAIALMQETGAVEKASKMSENLIKESCRKLLELYPENKYALLATQLFENMIPKQGA